MGGATNVARDKQQNRLPYQTRRLKASVQELLASYTPNNVTWVMAKRVSGVRSS
jgi:hypothetical protein